jgi:hypothetical protein
MVEYLGRDDSPCEIEPLFVKIGELDLSVARDPRRAFDICVGGVRDGEAECFEDSIPAVGHVALSSASRRMSVGSADTEQGNESSVPLRLTTSLNGLVREGHLLPVNFTTSEMFGPFFTSVEREEVDISSNEMIESEPANDSCDEETFAPFDWATRAVDSGCNVTACREASSSLEEAETAYTDFVNRTGFDADQFSRLPFRSVNFSAYFNESEMVQFAEFYRRYIFATRSVLSRCTRFCHDPDDPELIVLD